MVLNPNYDHLRRMSRSLRGKALVEVILVFIYLLFIGVLLTHNFFHLLLNHWLGPYANDLAKITSVCVIGFLVTFAASFAVIFIIPLLKKPQQPPRSSGSGRSRASTSTTSVKPNNVSSDSQSEEQ